MTENGTVPWEYVAPLIVVITGLMGLLMAMVKGWLSVSSSVRTGNGAPQGVAPTLRYDGGDSAYNQGVLAARVEALTVEVRGLREDVRKGFEDMRVALSDRPAERMGERSVPREDHSEQPGTPRRYYQ